MWARALTGGGVAQAVEQAQDELALCRRITAGEVHLFSRLIDRYSALVAGAITAQGVASDDVDDLAQQAFVNAYRGLAGFRGEARFSSWLYRIALNLARAHLKRQAGRPTAASLEEQAEAGQLPHDARPAQALSHAQSRSLDSALAQLTAPQRACVALYYFEELSYEEIAAALGLNLNTVRTHIRRGKLRLAELLDVGLLGE